MIENVEKWKRGSSVINWLETYGAWWHSISQNNKKAQQMVGWAQFAATIFKFIYNLLNKMSKKAKSNDSIRCTATSNTSAKMHRFQATWFICHLEITS